MLPAPKPRRSYTRRASSDAQSSTPRWQPIERQWSQIERISCVATPLRRHSGLTKTPQHVPTRSCVAGIGPDHSWHAADPMTSPLRDTATKDWCCSSARASATYAIIFSIWSAVHAPDGRPLASHCSRQFLTITSSRSGPAAITVYSQDSISDWVGFRRGKV